VLRTQHLVKKNPVVYKEKNKELSIEVSPPKVDPSLKEQKNPRFDDGESISDSTFGVVSGKPLFEENNVDIRKPLDPKRPKIEKPNF